MQYKTTLGYRKGEDGNPEIVPEEATVIERIYKMYLSGDTPENISRILRSENIVFPNKKFTFSKNMIQNILTNIRYTGDAILQKTITVDCIAKKRIKNTGEEVPMYYVHNSHPAIISRETYNKAQEERARRNARTVQSTKNSPTNIGKYSKYALTDILICGECGTRYRRCTWTARGNKRIVWRCVNRLDYGTKYCKKSKSVKESELHAAIVRAINRFNQEEASTYLTLMRATIGDAIGLNGSSDEADLLKRRIDMLNKRMLDLVNESVKNGGDIESHEDEFKELSSEIEQLQKRIKAIEETELRDVNREERLRQIQETIQERESHREEYDDHIVRQMIECIKVYPDGKLLIIFGGGYEIEESVESNV